MFTITAVIRAKAGAEDVVERALAPSSPRPRRTSPARSPTSSADRDDPAVFMTFERFIDAAAMAAHNESQAVAEFVAATQDSLDGPVMLHSCQELDAKLP